MASGMTDPTEIGYTPDPDLKVHDYAIRLLCQPYQSHENGLPEWAKNAADEYARRGDPEKRRVVVVILQNARGNRLASIACLDFCGIDSEVIDETFRHWGDPEAATRGETNATRIQGGHGNGGKCYMAQMFKDRAYLHTVIAGRGSSYGTVEGAVRFGYFPNRESGKDFAVPDLGAELERALGAIGANTRSLPPAAHEALSTSDGFSLVVGVDPKNYDGRLPTRHLLKSLEDHPQMRSTLEFCDLYVIANGGLLNEGNPLRLMDIQPLPGAETPRVIPISETLVDPSSGRIVSTTDDGALPVGALTLRTSDVSMRWGRKARHVISYRAESGFIGYRSVTEFDVPSSYRDRIYGECDLGALEPFKQNIRAELADSPLTRAVEAWIAKQIEEYARVFEARDQRRHSEEEKHAVAEMNEALNRWKNDLLSTVLIPGGGDGPGGPPPPPPLPSGVPARIELSLTHRRAGIGVPTRPTVRFYDKNGNRIRPTALRWTTSDTNIALVDDLSVLSTFSAGTATIEAETLEGTVRSNTVELEVVLIREIAITPSTVEVPLGSRRSLDAMCKLVSGEEASDVLLLWTEGNSEVARVSASGAVYGFQLGQTEVTAMDDRCIATNSAEVSVVENEGSDGDDGDGRRRGFPLVLISEYQPDPDTGEPVQLSGDDPPVHQRPQDADRNIWWINSAAPLARLYLDKDKGYGFESREWRIYHTERLIEVIVQIMMTTGPSSEDVLGPGEWIGRWGQNASDVQIAAAKGLTNFLATGELPTV
jgi:hypothetical protein